MAQVVREEVEETPRETVVVDRDRRSNVGVIIAVIVIVLLLLWFFGGSIFGGGGNGGTTNVDVETPAPTTSQ